MKSSVPLIVALLVSLLAGPLAQSAEKASVLPRDADKALLADLGETFKVLPSKHFLIYYNTTDNFARHRRLLFEKLHDVYSETFDSIGVPLRKGEGRLAVILLENEPWFRAYMGNPDLPDIAGVYIQEVNQIVFYDANTDRAYLTAKADVGATSSELKELRRQIRAIRDPVAKLRFTRIVGKYQKQFKTHERRLDGLIANQNVAVTIHEATHALSFNLGPLDHETRPPRWLAEGIATFFETPRVGKWRGAARFNAQRFLAYKTARDADGLPSLQEILTDEGILLRSETTDAAYGAVWSLFYFLYHEHPDACADILQRFREPSARPTDAAGVSEHARKTLVDFEAAMGSPPDDVASEWHAYMDQCEETFARDIEGWQRSQRPPAH